jgi:hypothetical protein
VLANFFIRAVHTMIFLTSFRKEYKCSYEKIIEKKKEFEISEEE